MLPLAQRRDRVFEFALDHCTSPEPAASEISKFGFGDFGVTCSSPPEMSELRASYLDSVHVMFSYRAMPLPHWYDPETDQSQFMAALWKVRAEHVRMTVPGSHVLVQAIMSAIDDYAERETGNREYSGISRTRRAEHERHVPLQPGAHQINVRFAAAGSTGRRNTLS
jgi:hypothetical protein